MHEVLLPLPVVNNQLSTDQRASETNKDEILRKDKDFNVKWQKSLNILDGLDGFVT